MDYAPSNSVEQLTDSGLWVPSTPAAAKSFAPTAQLPRTITLDGEPPLDFGKYNSIGSAVTLIIDNRWICLQQRDINAQTANPGQLASWGGGAETYDTCARDTAWREFEEELSFNAPKWAFKLACVEETQEANGSLKMAYRFLLHLSSAQLGWRGPMTPDFKDNFEALLRERCTEGTPRLFDGLAEVAAQPNVHRPTRMVLDKIYNPLRLAA